MKFASFNYPKKLWSLPTGKPSDRVGKTKICGDYYSVNPVVNPKSRGFYLDDNLGLRWQWCHEIHKFRRGSGYRLWTGDEEVHGIVITLNHSRGYLAGWSMGEGMASAIDYYIHDDIDMAACAADELARVVAEDEWLEQFGDLYAENV